MYNLVAAGTVRSNDLTGENTIGRLRAVGVTKGEITFTFDGYRMPDLSTRYAIRTGIVVTPTMTLPVPAAQVSDFRPEGFVLRATRDGALLTLTETRRIEFAIEVYRL